MTPTPGTGIRLILVSPLYSGNVGSAARAAANFGVEDLVLVNPQCDPQSFEARLMATGNSAALLDRIQVVDSLTAAIGDCHAAVALTRRQGRSRRPELPLKDLPTLSSKGRLALVFGREDSGLTQDEVQCCTHITAIPTSELMPSLNLSHAVAVILAGLFQSEAIPAASSTAPKEQEISVAEYEALLEHLRQTMLAVDLTADGNPNRLLQLIGKGLKRARMTVQEAQAFHGFLSQIIRKNPK